MKNVAWALVVSVILLFQTPLEAGRRKKKSLINQVLAICGISIGGKAASGKRKSRSRVAKSDGGTSGLAVAGSAKAVVAPAVTVPTRADLPEDITQEEWDSVDAGSLQMAEGYLQMGQPEQAAMTIRLAIGMTVQRITRAEFEALPNGTELYDIYGKKLVKGNHRFDMDKQQNGKIFYGFRAGITSSKDLDSLTQSLIDAGAAESRRRGYDTSKYGNNIGKIAPNTSIQNFAQVMGGSDPFFWTENPSMASVIRSRGLNDDQMKAIMDLLIKNGKRSITNGQWSLLKTLYIMMSDRI